MMVSKFNKDKQELLVRNEQTSQLICNNNNNNTNKNTCEDEAHEEVIYINTKLYKIPWFSSLKYHIAETNSREIWVKIL